MRNNIIAALCAAALMSTLLVGEALAAPMCFGERATIVGTNDFTNPRERLVGTPGADVIVGRDGNDIIIGRGGNDRICGGPGQDHIKAGKGRDRIEAGDHDCPDEQLYEELEGNGGHDLIVGSRCIDKIFGGNGNDTVRGGGSVLHRDIIFGGGGDDDLSYSPNDCDCNEGAIFVGGLGDDEMHGDGFLSVLDYSRAAAGVDVDLTTGSGTGEGSDTFSDIYWVIGSSHADELSGMAIHSALSGGAGPDRLTGGPDIDTLAGGLGDDVIDGSTGDDVISGDGGDDQISGGDGIDEASYYGHRSALHVDLMLGEATGQGTDTLDGIENVTGGRQDDVLLGDDGPNLIQDCCRSKSSDLIDGRGGDDVIYSQWGPDTLIGGPGNDRLIADNGDDSLDGGEGIDELNGDMGTDRCTNGEMLSGCESI